MIEYQTQFGASLLLSLNKVESMFDSNIIIMSCILSVEITAPLLSQFIEESIVLGPIKIKEFLYHNKDYFIAPFFAIPTIYGIQYYHLKDEIIRYNIMDQEIWKMGKFNHLPLKMSIVKVDQLGSDSLSYLIWNIVGAIYG